MKRSLPISLFFLLGLSLYSQVPLQQCGTPPGRSAWLKAYQQNHAAYRTLGDSVLFLNMALHNVGSDEGTGHMSVNQVLDAFCRLNLDMEQADIQFQIMDSVRYINDSEFNRHDTVISGARKMRIYNLPHALNSYFVSDPNGNCGYNIPVGGVNVPWSGIALNKGCVGPGNHTWAHEVGHNFSLPHTFLGWEGGLTWDGSMPPDYNQPAPERVTYDYTAFREVFNTDTLIIDTAWVEKTDGSNCRIAADGFCDTAPDYLYRGDNCNQSGESATLQTDPDSIRFRSDGSLIMSYMRDDCQNRFTPEQIAAMRANILDVKPDFLLPGQPLPAIPEDAPITLISPVDDELVSANEALLVWEPVDGATHYLVQVGLLPSFAALVGQMVVDEPTAAFRDLPADRTLYWRIRPFNNYSTCRGFSERAQFTTSDVSAVLHLNGLDRFTVAPNAVTQGSDIQVRITLSQPLEATLIVTDLTGRTLLEKRWEQAAGEGITILSTANLPKGLLLVGLRKKDGVYFEKLIVQ